MGKKGDQLMDDTALSKEVFLGKLIAIGNVSSKKMFGGYGIFHEGKMFGMITAK